MRGSLKRLIRERIPLAPYQPLAKLGPIVLVVPSLLRLFQRGLHAFLAFMLGQGHFGEDHHRLPLATLMQGMLILLGCGRYFRQMGFLGGMMTGTIVIGLLYLV